MSTTLPQGWRIERNDQGQFVAFEIYEEEGGARRSDGTPRAALTVELWHNSGVNRYGEPLPPEIGWPSTSDKRPELAQALAVALQMAAKEASSKEGPLRSEPTAKPPCDACHGTTTGQFCEAHSWHRPQ